MEYSSSSICDANLWIILGCLKILSPEELEHLEIPVREEANSPVSKVLYISENDTPFLGGNNTLSQEHTDATRFNLFTGSQTLDQRSKTFKVISYIFVSNPWTGLVVYLVIVILRIKVHNKATSFFGFWCSAIFILKHVKAWF